MGREGGARTSAAQKKYIYIKAAKFLESNMMGVAVCAAALLLRPSEANPIFASGKVYGLTKLSCLGFEEFRYISGFVLMSQTSQGRKNGHNM